MKKALLIFLLIMSTCRVASAIEKINMSVQDVIIQKPEEVKIYTNNWSNDKISIQFRLTWFGFLFRLTNNTDHPMLLIWNKSAMVDENGSSHRLIPGETRNIHKALPVPETMIPPHVSYADLAGVPECGPKYYPNGRTIEKYLFILDYPVEYDWFGNIKGLSSKKSKKYKNFTQKYVGRTISMILCLNVNGQDEYYDFNMTLDFYKGTDVSDFDADTIKTQTPISLGWGLDGATIKYINPGESADKAGLSANDIVLEINGRPFLEVDSPQIFIEKRFSEGRSVMLLILRNGEQKMVTLKKE